MKINILVGQPQTAQPSPTVGEADETGEGLDFRGKRIGTAGTCDWRGPG